MRRFLSALGRSLCLTAVALACVPIRSEAIVIRHDVDDEVYAATEEEFPALVDLPGDGHGVLIAPQWIVTVAHGVELMGGSFAITIAGQARVVSKVFMHPGYKPAPLELTSGDAAPLLAFARARHDIALLRLMSPVRNVKPVKLYRGTDELGKLVTLYGKGRTGNGLTGQDQNSPTRGVLRHAENVITTADGHWIGYRFDTPDAARPLEGMLGNGDSGGPILLKEQGEWRLLGINAFMDAHGDLSKIRFATYGTTGYQARMSAYVEWINATMASSERPFDESEDRTTL